MKVPDFLNLVLQEDLIYYNKFSQLLSDKFGIINVKSDFYNLPFTPDLITRFFKGWDLRFNDTKDFYEINNFKKEISISSHHNKITYFINKIWYESSLPIVLNDFIRDCFRCKIELEM